MYTPYGFMDTSAPTTSAPTTSAPFGHFGPSCKDTSAPFRHFGPYNFGPYNFGPYNFGPFLKSWKCQYKAVLFLFFFNYLCILLSLIFN